MTVTVDFTPSNASAPPWRGEFNLDGKPYVASAFWSTYGQRWYIKLTTHAGDLVAFVPLIGSPSSSDIPLFPGLFNTQAVYREAAGQFEIGASAPSGQQAQQDSGWAKMVNNAVASA